MLRVQRAHGIPIRALLIRDYARMGLSEMAGRYGVSATTVAAWMDRLGIERRLPGQPPPEDPDGTPD